MQPERDFWQLAGTRIEDYLRTPIELANSRLESLPLQPATEPALQAWFAKSRSVLRSGDTLLLYVTDHGTRNDKDPRNNRISLWGRNADLTVDELGALMSRLDPGVRVVALMSQCFSGGFARLYETRPIVGGRGGFCGYFSVDPRSTRLWLLSGKPGQGQRWLLFPRVRGAGSGSRAAGRAPGGVDHRPHA